MDMQKYWGSVRQTMEGLPAPPYYLTSLNTPDGGVAGRVVEVTDGQQAAKLLVGNSHRHATPVEIEQFHAAEKLAVEQLAEIEMKRKQHFAMPTEMTALLAALANQQGEKKERK